MALSRNRIIGNLASAIDSASQNSFLSKASEDGEYKSVAYSDLSGAPTVLDSAGISAVIDSSYTQLRITPATGPTKSVDSAVVTSLIDSNYVTNRAAAASNTGFTTYNYTATAGQTTFQDSDLSGNILSYTAGGTMVWMNGVMLKETADWTGSDGSSIVLDSAANAGAKITIAKWNVLASGGASSAIYGDRGIIGAGYDGSNRLNNIDYWDMTTSNNASDFGDLNVSVQQPGATSDAIRGLFAGGYDGANRPNFIDYITIASPGNATDFGDLSTASSMAVGGVSDATYGVFGGRYVTTPGAADDTIDYVTIQTTGDASDFGNLTEARFRVAPISNSTYGLFAGGLIFTKPIDYITIATPGNASDFGDLIFPKEDMSSGGFDDTRGIIAGGYSSHFGSKVNIIEYVTIATPGNATDFGDLLNGNEYCACTSNGTYVHICGGTETSETNTIQQITVQTTGNSSDFADLTAAKSQTAGCSGSPS